MSRPARVTPATSPCLPPCARATAVSPGASSEPMAMRATTIAAASASGQTPGRPASRIPAGPSAPALTSASASRTPASAPTTDTSADNGTTSAAVSVMSCQRVAPRAMSSAVSPSRWAASSRPTAASATMASTRICRTLITSSDRATVRLLPAASSAVGRFVASCAPFRKAAFGSEAARAATLAASGPRFPSGKAAMSGCASQDVLCCVSAEPKAPWLTTSGP